MTIEMLLGLKLDMMRDTNEALAVLEEAWKGENQPTESQGVIRVLKITLDRCNLRGIVYPRIFLRRKGELQRGEFQPRGEVSSVVDPASVKFTASSHPKIPTDWMRQAVEESLKSAQAKWETVRGKSRAMREFPKVAGI